MKKNDKVRLHSFTNEYRYLNDMIGKIESIMNSLYDGQLIYKILFDTNIGSLYIRENHLEIIK